MTISIKLSERGKKLLDTIQAEMMLKLGEKVSQQELLELVLEEAERRKDALIKRISRRPHVPLSKEGLKRLMGLPRDWGSLLRKKRSTNTCTVDRSFNGIVRRLG